MSSREPTAAPPIDAKGNAPLDSAEQRLLREIVDVTELAPEIDVSDALQAVFEPLLARLSRGQARALLATFPESVRRRFEPAMSSRGEEGEAFGADELFRRIGDRLRVTPDEARQVAGGVIAAVHRTLSNEEVAQVESQLPHDLKNIWRAGPARRKRNPAGNRAA
ncbi:DUF2267 domain-containing protein [Sorangium sp. So ce426]|uniref:DUF2267 domain-containing protein n=1 Tax=unclassified Sorangium TaxID=2621164 RepID=UPI003F5B6404